MIITISVIIGLGVGFFVGYSFAYSDIVDKAFASKANNESFEISSYGKKATLKVEHIEA